MKRFILMLILAISANTVSTISIAASTKNNGMIDQVDYIKSNIVIKGSAYKLSNTVKVYGLGGDKYLNVKKLTLRMYVDFKYSTRKDINTISEIWVQPN